MSEFHEGRVSGLFQCGNKADDLKEIYEHEVNIFMKMKEAFTMVVHGMEAHLKEVKDDLASSRMSLKESEVAGHHILRDIEFVKKLFMDTEAKRLVAAGAVEALTMVIKDFKGLWDEEKVKLQHVAEFEATKPRNLRDRPVGYMPSETPLEQYKQESSEVPEPDVSIVEQVEEQLVVDGNQESSADLEPKKRVKAHKKTDQDKV